MRLKKRLKQRRCFKLIVQSDFKSSHWQLFTKRGVLMIRRKAPTHKSFFSVFAILQPTTLFKRRIPSQAFYSEFWEFVTCLQLPVSFVSSNQLNISSKKIIISMIFIKNQGSVKIELRDWKDQSHTVSCLILLIGGKYFVNPECLAFGN